MRKISLSLIAVSVIILAFNACSKSGPEDNNSAITVENLAGTYGLQASMWNYLGQDINVYDSLDGCEKDNLTRLNTNLTLDFIDAGTVCVPPEDDNGTWELRGDSLFVVESGSSSASKIESFNGTTLVLSGEPYPGVRATTTLAKQ